MNADPMNTFAERYTAMLWPGLVVSGAGDQATNGTYLHAGYYNGYPYWVRNGDADPGNPAAGGAACVYLETPGGNWIVGDANNGGYNSTAPATPVLLPSSFTYVDNGAGNPPPTVTPATSLVPSGRLLLNTNYQTLATLGLTEDILGPANAILLGALPLDMELSNDSVFLYTFNGSGAAISFGFTSAKPGTKVSGWRKPILIEGRDAMNALKLASLVSGNQWIYYQLLLGNT